MGLFFICCFRSRSRSSERVKGGDTTHENRSRMRSDSSVSINVDRDSKRSRRSRSRSPGNQSRDRDYDREHDRDRDRGTDRRDRDYDRDRGADRRYRGSDRDRDRERDRDDRSRYLGMTGAQIEREKAKRRLEEQARLRRDDYIEWKFKLANLDLSRESIKTAMGFAYDKVESAEEVGAN